jgi:hypothetical protein
MPRSAFVGQTNAGSSRRYDRRTHPMVGMDRPCRFTILGLAEHVLFKTGRYRAMARWYFDQRQPFYVGNLPFAALPFGLMFACWGPCRDRVPISGATVGGPHRTTDLPRLLGSVRVGMRRQLRPPAGAKPGWLKPRKSADGPQTGAD